MSVASIRSDGDLEIMLMHEAHDALAEIVGPNLYEVRGSDDDQEAWFRSESHFNLFLILVVEIFAEGPRSAYIDEKYQSWSLLTGLSWLCTRYPSEASASGLVAAVSALDAWVAREVPVRFWCPDVDAEVEVLLSNRQLIVFGANAAKHHLFRLAELLGRLETICQRAGHQFSPQELAAVLASMVPEVRSRLAYHGTYLVEMLGRLFHALNTFIVRRYAANPTNRVSDMTMPPGVTSDVFRNLYGAVLVFKQYPDGRILSFTPKTSRFMKLRYQ